MRLRGQSSVEFLVVLSVIMGLLVVMVIPALRQFEISLATAASRTALTGLDNEVFTGLRMVEKEGGRVDVVVSLLDRKTHAPVAVPDSLKSKIAFAIQSTLSPANSFSGYCASSASLIYCVV